MEALLGGLLEAAIHAIEVKEGSMILLDHGPELLAMGLAGERTPLSPSES